MGQAFNLRRANWPRDREALRTVREAVFVREQNVPIELEWDGLDDDCLHILAEDGAGNPIGTGRLLPDGHIGRMAVLQAWRGKGVGTAILTELMQAARERNLPQVVLNAQTRALDFYARLGFVAEAEAVPGEGEFLDAGIPHRRMHCRLTSGGQGSGTADD